MAWELAGKYPAILKDAVVGTEATRLFSDAQQMLDRIVKEQWLQAHGADAIIAQGLEAGGHRGMFLTEDLSTQIGTFALLPQIVRAVQVPVIAAGGIATVQGVAAVKALGASAVQIGTAYLCSHEATTSALHRTALQSPAAQHTALTHVFSGRPARGIVNRLMRELGPLCPQAPAFPMATAGIAPLRSAAEAQGSSDFSPLWSGQNASVCRTAAAADITRDFLRAWNAARAPSSGTLASHGQRQIDIHLHRMRRHQRPLDGQMPQLQRLEHPDRGFERTCCGQKPLWFGTRLAGSHV